MLELRHARRWQAASVFLLLAVLVAALMPAVWYWDGDVAALSWIEDFDKSLHGFTFLALTVWFVGLYRKHTYWRIALGLLAFGFAIEFFQRMVSYRTADILDIVADAAGIAIGLIIAYAGVGGWCQKIEDRLVKGSGGRGD